MKLCKLIESILDSFLTNSIYKSINHNFVNQLNRSLPVLREVDVKNFFVGPPFVPLVIVRVDLIGADLNRFNKEISKLVKFVYRKQFKEKTLNFILFKMIHDSMNFNSNKYLLVIFSRN